MKLIFEYKHVFFPDPNGSRPSMVCFAWCVEGNCTHKLHNSARVGVTRVIYFFIMLGMNNVML
jgi:hypothetical protein